MYKKILSIFLSIMVALSIAIPISAADTNKNTFTDKKISFKELSSRSGEECIQELQKFGLTIPEAYSSPEQAQKAIKVVINDLILGFLNDGMCPYNFTGLRDLAQQVQVIASVYDPSLTSYTLKDSTIFGSWNDSFYNYNCYGYAIDEHIFVDPGYHSDQSFDPSYSISEMADLVLDDLDALGYWGYKTTQRPSILSSWEELICIRKGSVDYHFMKGITTSEWRHKPGNSHILKWNYSSPGYKIWTNEAAYPGVILPGEITYNSTIYYIIYWDKDGPGPDPYYLEQIQN